MVVGGQELWLTLCGSPLRLHTATLADLKLRLQFFEGKLHSLLVQKKKQHQGQELCLVSLADLDGFYKAGKWAEAKGQKFKNWITSVGKKTLLSWSARAASRGATSDQI